MKIINLIITLYLLCAFSVSAQFSNVNVTDNEYDQSETVIAINPLNSTTFLAAWNDFRLTGNNNLLSKPGYSFSTDNGENWNTSGIVTNLLYGFDPSVAFDGNGTAYYCYIGTNNWNSIGRVYVSKSTNLGPPWTNIPVSTNLYYQDKPWMTVDNTGGNFDGNLYFSWTDFTTGYSRIKFRYSTDGGNSFSNETVLAQANQEADVSVYSLPRSSSLTPILTGPVVQGSIPVVGVEGNVFVIWLLANTSTGDGTIYLRRSTDGGATFGTSNLVAELPLFQLEQFYSISQSFPSIVIDKNNGNLYVSYSEGYGGGNGHTMLRFVKSTDLGVSWSDPIYINYNTNAYQVYSSVSVDENGKITIFFQEDHDEYIVESFDEGENFLTPLKITNNSFNYNPTFSYHYQGLKNTKGGDSYCVWTDLSTEQVDVYFSKANSLLHYAANNQSLDVIATNSNNQRKLVKDSLGNYNLVFSSFGEILYKLSTDGGNNWISVDRLSSGDGICSNPSITTYDDYIFVTWQQYDGLVSGQYKYEIKGVWRDINSSTWKPLFIYDPEVYFSSEIDPLPVLTATGNVDNNYSSDDGLPEVMIAFQKSDGIYHINLFYEDTPHDDVDEGYEQKGTIHKIPNTYTGYTYPSITVNGNGTIMLTCNSSSGSMYAFSTTGGSWYSYSSSIFSTSLVGSYGTSCITSDGANAFHIVWKGINHISNNTTILHKKISLSLDPVITEFTYGTYDSYQPSAFGHLDQDGGVSIYWNTGADIKRSINDGTRWDYSGNTFVPSIQTDGNYVNSIDRADPDFPAYVYTGTEGPLYDINTVISSGLSKITENGDTIRTYRKAYYYNEELDVLLSLQIGNFRATDYSGNELQIDPEDFNKNISLQNFNSALSELLSDVIPNGQLNKIIFDYRLEMKNLYQLKAGNNNNPRMSFVLKNRNNGNVLFSTDTVYLPLDSSLHIVSGSQGIVLNNWNQNNNISLALKMQGIHQNFLNQSDNFNLVNTYFINSGSISKKDDRVNNLVLRGYELSENYPNPFNPTTTINYQLPQTGFVTLKVYDILGKEVAALVNEQKNQGRYSVNFDASHISSGVYIYQLRVNDYVSSKKMLLLK